MTLLGDERSGREAVVDFARTFRNAFSDWKAEVEQLVAEGDFVVSRLRVSGTHTGDLMGMGPTGKKVDLKGVLNMMRIRNGKVVEEWEVFDEMLFMKQLGNTG